MDREGIARSEIDDLRARVESLERNLRELFDRLGYQVPKMGASDEVASGNAAAEGEIVALLQQGNTIQAIKTYRNMTGADLATAKAAVERLAATHGLG